MTRVHEKGFFEAVFPDRSEVFPYQLRRKGSNGEIAVFHDSYSFMPTLTDFDIYLFNAGDHHRIYDKLAGFSGFGGISDVKRGERATPSLGAVTVISPAMGGLVIGQEVARQLRVRFIFAEKEDGKLTLRRGFRIAPGEKLLIVEDVVTKGGRVQVVLGRAESHVEIGVSDSGVGISPEFLPHVFEPFQQEMDGSKRQHGGLGLGLAGVVRDDPDFGVEGGVGRDVELEPADPVVGAALD